jgi:hypothetical protein
MARSPFNVSIAMLLGCISKSKLEVLCGDHFCREITVKRSTCASAWQWPSVTPAPAALSMSAQAWLHLRPHGSACERQYLCRQQASQ